MLLQSHRLESASTELKEAIKTIAENDLFKEYDLSIRNCTEEKAGFAFYDIVLNVPVIPKGITAEIIADESGCNVTQEGFVFWLT